MPRRTPQLAKLTRPRLARTVRGERLFKLLDAARDTRTAACVVGPPGAGKTTLVAPLARCSRHQGDLVSDRQLPTGRVRATAPSDRGRSGRGSSDAPHPSRK